MRSPDIDQWIDECIGPRRVGTVWREYRHGDRIRVLAVNRNPDRGLWEITEMDLEGSQQGWVRTHCTAWDVDRNVVVSQPEVAS